MFNTRSQSCRSVSVGILVVLLMLGGAIVSQAAHAADPSNGQQLYSKHCRGCHGASGQAQLPGVADFSRGEGLMTSDMGLLALIKSGRGMMPAYRGLLSDEEILDVIAHLRTLRRR